MTFDISVVIFILSTFYNVFVSNLKIVISYYLLRWLTTTLDIFFCEIIKNLLNYYYDNIFLFLENNTALFLGNFIHKHDGNITM